MSIISSIPPPRKWNHRHIILVTLIGCLVVNAISAAISVSLSPAHMSFSIKDAATSNKTSGDDEDTMYYSFTLQVKNTSPRMEVHYSALNAEVWYSATTWVPAVVDRSALQDDGTMQPPRSLANLTVSAEYWQSEQQSIPPPPAMGSGGGGKDKPPSAAAAGGDDDDNNNTDWSNCTVLVTASVWFKSRWWIRTRAYDVTANCPQVNFGNRTAIVDCK